MGVFWNTSESNYLRMTYLAFLLIATFVLICIHFFLSLLVFFALAFALQHFTC